MKMREDSGREGKQRLRLLGFGGQGRPL